LILRLPIMVFTFLLLAWSAGIVAFMVHVKGIPAPDTAHTDAIIVLTGGPDRINTGLDLLAAKQAEYLFISGVNTDVSVNKLLSLWRKDNQEAPPCCVVLGHVARNTLENAAEARDWIKENNVGSARLLTADYHMPRAKLAFELVMPQMDIYTHPIISARTNWFLIFQEYNKTLYTLFRLKLEQS